MALVDREAGGAERIRQEIARYVPVFTKSEFPTGA